MSAASDLLKTIAPRRPRSREEIVVAATHELGLWFTDAVWLVLGETEIAKLARRAQKHEHAILKIEAQIRQLAAAEAPKSSIETKALKKIMASTDRILATSGDGE